MTSLEYIEKEIEDKKENIKHWEKQLERYPNDEVFTRGLNKSKEQLQTLQQIKSELVTWEVVKLKILITDGGVIHMAIEDDDIVYETVIKALEVKND